MPGIHRPMPAAALGRVFGVPLRQALPALGSWWPAPRWRRGVPGVPRRSRAPRRGPRCSDKAVVRRQVGSSRAECAGTALAGSPTVGSVQGEARSTAAQPSQPFLPAAWTPCEVTESWGWAGARARCQAENRLVLERRGPGMPGHCGRVVAEGPGGSAVPPALLGCWAGWVATAGPACAGRWEPLGRCLSGTWMRHHLLSWSFGR